MLATLFLGDNTKMPHECFKKVHFHLLQEPGVNKSNNSLKNFIMVDAMAY